MWKMRSQSKANRLQSHIHTAWNSLLHSNITNIEYITCSLSRAQINATYKSCMYSCCSNELRCKKLRTILALADFTLHFQHINQHCNRKWWNTLFFFSFTFALSVNFINSRPPYREFQHTKKTESFQLFTCKNDFSILFRLCAIKSYRKTTGWLYAKMVKINLRYRRLEKRTIKSFGLCSLNKYTHIMYDV